MSVSVSVGVTRLFPSNFELFLHAHLGGPGLLPIGEKAEFFLVDLFVPKIKLRERERVKGPTWGWGGLGVR